MPLPSKQEKRAVSELAAEIRRRRIRLNLTQGQFAREIGVSQQTISDWERRKRLRQVQLAMRLHRFLGK